jgi:enoyl-CoA hydratase
VDSGEIIEAWVFGAVMVDGFEGQEPNIETCPDNDLKSNGRCCACAFTTTPIHQHCLSLSPMIELTQHGRIAYLTVRRAPKKNAFTLTMWQDLLMHCQALATASKEGHGDAPRALLLQGGSGQFCAGADIEEMARTVTDAQALAHNNSVVSQAQQALENLPIPSIAAIDGPCFGGGFGLAAACDFRLGSPRAIFAVTPAKLGLLYSLEDTRRLLRLVGDARARQLLLRGERLDANTALQWGVLNAIVSVETLESTATQWASDLAQQSRTSMAGIKATLAVLGRFGSADDAQVRAAYDAAFVGADFKEGAAAFLQKRRPNF